MNVFASLLMCLTMMLGCRAPLPKSGAYALDAAPAREPPAAVHGMVVFGTDQLYASHIPMYHVPHDWQALFAIELSHPSVDVKALYLAQFTAGKQPLFTIEPKPFVLPRLLDGRMDHFAATLYLGNFEGDHERLVEGVTVVVTQVLYAQHLSKNTAALPSLTYLILPTDSQSAYLIHEIAAPDNFDHLLQVTTSTQAGDSLQTVTFDAPEEISQRLRADQQFQLSATSDGWSAVSSGGSGPQVKVSSDFYCTPGPNFSGSCG